MKTQIIASKLAKLNSAPPHFSSLKFGFLKPFIASIMATLLTLGLPGIVVGQCIPYDLAGHCLFRNYNFGVSNHSFSLLIYQVSGTPCEPETSHASTGCDGGDFEFDDYVEIPSSSNSNLSVAEVTPYTDNDVYDYQDGVTAADVAAINKHVLGIEYITDPYKIVAADPTGNQIIDSNDRVAIYNLILYNTLFNRTSWDWFNEYQVANNSSHFNSNPFAYSVWDLWTDQIIIYPSMSHSTLVNYQNRYLHYRTTKVGEIDNTTANAWVCDTYTFKSPAVSARSGTDIQNLKVPANSELRFSVAVEINEPIVSLELPIRIDKSLFTIKDISSTGNFPINYAYSELTNRLTILWVDANLKELKTNGESIILNFTLIANKSIDNLTNEIIWDPKRQVEATNMKGHLISTNARIILDDVIQGNLSMIYNHNLHEIQIHSNNSGFGELMFFNSNGNNLYSEKIKLTEGKIIYQIPQNFIHGIYFARIKANEKVLSIKFIAK
ncbi:MAG: hypothetical protein IT264_04820 [Saprospiraceae bacterium]|nr:hypothetical protein [Saprospiraceae bacterium]